MKKLLICLLVFTMAMLAGCSTETATKRYTGIHVCGMDGNVNDFYMEDYHTYAGGVNVQTEYGEMFCSVGTYVLYNGKCPICNN